MSELPPRCVQLIAQATLEFLHRLAGEPWHITIEITPTGEIKSTHMMTTQPL